MSGRATLTCPWCPDWKEIITGTDEDETVERGRRKIKAHDVEAGHTIKAGREPRVGYYRGDPIS